MKKTLLSVFFFVIAFSFIATQHSFSNEPIVIDSSNFTFTPNDTMYAKFLTLESLQAIDIKVGADQIFDLSNVQTTADEDTVVDNVNTYQEYFPTATLYWENNYTIFGAYLRTLEFDQIGYYGLKSQGFLTDSLFLPLSQDKTSNLIVPKQVVKYTPELVKVPFPLTYQGQTVPATYQTKRMINATFNYPSLGLVNVPVGHQQTTEFSIIVTGWGTLLLPGYSEPINVLQVATQVVYTDTIFLNGTPAPEILLSQLGLTQGQRTMHNTIRFLRENTYANVFRYTRFVGIDGDTTHSAYYFKSKEITSVKESANNNAFTIYPNPSNGRNLHILNNSNSDIKQVEIYNNLGICVFKKELSGSQNNINISFPTQLAKGIYFYNFIDSKSNIINGKFIVSE